MSSSPNERLWDGLSERERLEMRKEQAIRASQREARQLAKARRFRRIRSLTLAQVTYLASALIFALLLALVAMD